MNIIKRLSLLLMLSILSISASSSTHDPSSTNAEEENLPPLRPVQSVDILTYASHVRRQCLNAFYFSASAMENLHVVNNSLRETMQWVRDNKDDIKATLIEERYALQKMNSEKLPRPNFRLHSSKKQLLKLEQSALNCSDSFYQFVDFFLNEDINNREESTLQAQYQVHSYNIIVSTLRSIHLSYVFENREYKGFDTSLSGQSHYTIHAEGIYSNLLRIVDHSDNLPSSDYYKKLIHRNEQLYKQATDETYTLLGLEKAISADEDTVDKTSLEIVSEIQHKITENNDKYEKFLQSLAEEAQEKNKILGGFQNTGLTALLNEKEMDRLRFKYITRLFDAIGEFNQKNTGN